MTTPDKPEVHAIAATLDLEPEQVLGCLCRIWIWADEQSLNGHAVSVTEKALDRVTRVAGFAKAMRSAGWLTGEDGSLTFPNFGYHNGKSAKSRALAQRRKQVERVTKASRSERDISVTREEKRRSKPPVVPQPGFERFWAAWPPSERKEAKGECSEKWMKGGCEAHVDDILAHVESLKVSERWKEGYIVAPVVYLNQRRWEGASAAPFKRVARFPI